jgi:hypothetical protein
MYATEPVENSSACRVFYRSVKTSLSIFREFCR